MNRRNFCAGVLSSAFLYELLSLKMIGLTNEAFGATGSTPLKNYVSFWMGGGAERHWFDGILTPNGQGDTLGSKPGVWNFLKVSEGNKWDYRTTHNKVNDKFYLPYLWESVLPTVGGGGVAMKTLAFNTAIVRGIHTGLTFDAHSQNSKMMQVPFPNISILGSIADNSHNIFIPAIMSSGSFISHTNKAASSVSPRGSANEIFQSLEFNSSSTSSYSRSPVAVLGHKKMDNIVTSFINSIQSQLPSRSKKTMEVMMENRKVALQLIDRGFAGINDDYEAAYLDYMSIIEQVMNPTSERILEGLDDRPINGSGLRVQLSLDYTGKYNNGSIIDGFRTARCRSLASAFAKAEVFLRHNISNCMQFSVSGIEDISDQHSSNSSHRRPFDFDCHNTGDLMRGVAWSRYYQSFAACLLHFKGRLGGTLWGQTLVNLRSEFNRGISYERGSDHGIHACVESYFSGSIQQGPIVVGNIYDRYGTNSSCIGDGAPIEELGNQIPDSKHNYSTIGSLMGFTPSRNHQPLLGPVGGKIVPLVSGPKNIKRLG